jgi:Icc-related predicted phosphoesterase
MPTWLSTAATIGGLSNCRRALESLAACSAEVKLVIACNRVLSFDAEWRNENLDSDDDEDEPTHAHVLFTSDGHHLGCRRLWEAIERVRPKIHYFGHIREGYGAQMAMCKTVR